MSNPKNIETELLSNEELQTLRRELKSFYLTSISLLLMVVIMVHLFTYISINRWIIPKYEIIVILGILFTFYLLTRKMSQSLRTEIYSGIKTIKYLPITEKYSYKERDDRFSDEYINFVIIADDQKFVVSQENFEKAEVGDHIEVHQTSVRERRLKTEIVKITSP